MSKASRHQQSFQAKGKSDAGSQVENETNTSPIRCPRMWRGEVSVRTARTSCTPATARQQVTMA